MAEVLRRAGGIGEADPPEVVAAKLVALLGDDPERAAISQRNAALLGVGEPASAQETFWALRRGLEILARGRPIVLVLDDVHWGQPLFLDLLEHLVEWVRDAPVLLVALARPELRERRDALTIPGRRPSDVIELGALDAEESLALLRGMSGRVELPAALGARILEATEGNPLFLGEMLRMLVDEGVLRRDGDVLVAGRAAGEIDVPPTIQALLAARLERLDSRERTVVEHASVIGKQFYRGAVADLVAGEIGLGIDTHLAGLRRKDMVEPDGTYWIDEPVYRFHHVLIRDAAYRSLLKEARAELHERFAVWLQTKAGELVGEHEEVIAFHLEQAHEYRRQLGPLDAAGRALGEQAAQRLSSAGGRALEREDLAAAANLLQRALDRMTEEDPEILWHLCEALLSAGDTSAAGPVVERLEAAAGADPRRRARAVVMAAQLASLTGAAEAAAESVEAAAAELEGLGDATGAAKAHHVAVQVHARLGRVGAAEQALDRALTAAQQAGDRRRVRAALAGAPRAALWGPSSMARASGRCLDVVRILRMTPGNRHVEASALRCQAVLEAMRGRPDTAREIFDTARVTLEELGLTLELHETDMYAGIVELLADDLAAAVALLRSARDGFAALGVAAGAGQAASLLARALVEEGREDEALEQTRYAEQHGAGDLKSTIAWCGARADALSRRGEHDEALELARRAVALAGPTDALADKADASMALARVLAAAGQADAARSAASTAHELYAAKGHAIGVRRATALASGDAGPAGATPAMPGEDLTAGGDAAPVLGDRPPERALANYVRVWARKDPEQILGLYTQDFIMIDHRKMAWDVVDDAGLEGFMRSVLETVPDIRCSVNEVLACDERVIAARVTWNGTGADTGGAVEFGFGYVWVVEGGRWRSEDIYEPDDEHAVRHRYAQLGGRPAGLGDRVLERAFADFAQAHAVGDVDAFLALFTEDFTAVDHRALPWDPYRGKASAREMFVSLLGAFSNIRLDAARVLACDDRVISLRADWAGQTQDGADWSYPMGWVSVFEDGLVLSQEFFEPDDDHGMLHRYAQLGGTPPGLGDRPPERAYTALSQGFATNDLDALQELYAADWFNADHRVLPWDPGRGKAGARNLCASLLSAFADARLVSAEVLACDDRVIAMRTVWGGRAADGGDWEIPMGFVTVVEGGLLQQEGYFEPDDDQGMLRRYAELGGRPP